MQIQLSEHFSYKKLLLFSLPSVIMMIFTSVYGVVDGVFVSNFVGKTQFSAINLIAPFLMIFPAVGFMIGTGGSALVSKTIGEGENERANSIFSFLVLFTLFTGIAFSFVGVCLLKPVARMFKAEGELLDACVLYGMILVPAFPAYMLQNLFQSFLVTAEKPKLGLLVTVAAGCTNIVLDALFVAVFHWGLAGAAIATVIAQLVGGVIPLCYFLSPNGSLLRIGKTKFDKNVLWKTCANGSSEFLTNISMSVVNMLYNFQLMRIAGEDGVAAYGAIMYVNFIFISVFLGYAIGSAPVIGYHFGAQNREELRSLRKKSLNIVGIFAIGLTLAAELLAAPLSEIFVGYDAALLKMTIRGFSIYSFSFLLAGFNIFASSFFTALNDGFSSACISFLRTLVFQIFSVLILPVVFQLDGIWFSVLVAESLALVVSVLFLVFKRKKYGY